MSILIKENTIFEEVENKCNTFINDSPVMDKYKKREIDSYFFNKSLELDLKKAKEQGIAEGREEGIAEGREEGIAEGREEGKINKSMEIAKEMKNKNMDINLINELTGLSIDIIEKL